MALRMVRLESDEILRKKSKPVKEITESVLVLLDDMVETMRGKEGVGLAAPQVGVLKRVVVIDYQGEIYELINPEFLEKSGSQKKTEGCLSIPGKSGTVERPEYVKVKALNRQGEEIVLEGRDTLAVIFCHEIDHLDGVLYIDKAISMEDYDDDDEYEEYEEDE